MRRVKQFLSNYLDVIAIFAILVGPTVLLVRYQQERDEWKRNARVCEAAGGMLSVVFRANGEHTQVCEAGNKVVFILP